MTSKKNSSGCKDSSNRSTCYAFTPKIESKESILPKTESKPERHIEAFDQTEDKAWIDEPSILFKNNTWYKFIPSKGMSKNQILNTFMRFGFYYFIIMLFIRRSFFSFFILLLTLALSLYLYNSNLLSDYSSNLDPNIPLEFTTKIPPSEHNPFMNTLISEIGNNKHRPESETIHNKYVEKEADYYFNKNLYKNTNDIYSRNNSQFVYHQVPNTGNFGVNAGDKVLFANYLYNQPRPTCKENSSFCNNEWSLNDDFKNIAQRSQPLNPYEKTMIEQNVLTDLNHQI